MSASGPSPLFLAGPTGSGKSGVAMALARRCRGEIVNADAFQVYRGLELLAATPSVEERRELPHHLYACLEPSQAYHAADFAERARPLLHEIRERGNLAIVVGGSGLYLKALTHGIDPTPPGDDLLRDALQAYPSDTLEAWLRQVDGAAADRVDPRNRRYLTRALEIAILSGQRTSELRRSWDENPDPRMDGTLIFLSRRREDLYERINRRTESMFTEGLEDEVAALGELSVTAEKAIGLSLVREVLAGKRPRTEAIAAMQQATRHYAKRQETWFRREKSYQSVCAGPSDGSESLAEHILTLAPGLSVGC